MPSISPAGHVAQVRAASLTNYVSLAGSLGLDGLEMLREFGLSPQLLANPESRIPADAASNLLAESARRSGCETFGLRLAELRSFSSLGPLSLLLRHERNLRAVLRRLIAYRRLMSDILDFDLSEQGDEARVLIGVSPEVARRQSVELAMGLTCRFLSGAMFGGWQPAEAHFRYPPPGDLDVHQRIFRSTLRFNASFNGFVIPTASLDRENASADAGFVEHAEHYVDLLCRELPAQSLGHQVRASINVLLPDGVASLRRVAAHLNMHPRALQRKLAADGLNFAELVEKTRADLARDLLAETELPLSEVALLLGYASPASFSRWFAASAGMPPREWRRQNGLGRR
jgi:AraC-like DNA-binding protein